VSIRWVKTLRDEALEHKAGEGDDVPAPQRLRQPLDVAPGAGSPRPGFRA